MGITDHGFDNLKTSTLDIEPLKEMLTHLKNPLTFSLPIDHAFIDEVEKSLLKQRWPSVYKELFNK